MLRLRHVCLDIRVTAIHTIIINNTNSLIDDDDDDTIEILAKAMWESHLRWNRG